MIKRFHNIAITTILIFIFSLLCMRSYAYDSNLLHPNINKEAVFHSDNLQRQLINLGYTKGLEDKLSIVTSYDTASKRFQMFDFFRTGGTKEDKPIWRAFNHFHDPLLSWKKAGLKNWSFTSSSLAWASGAYWVDNDASWLDARVKY